MPGNEFDLTPIEQQGLDLIATQIAQTRDERAEKVGVVMDALAEFDEVTRFVAGVAIRYYIDTTNPAELVVEPHALDRLKILYEAPGLFMSFGPLKDRLMETGEFTNQRAFRESAAALSLNPKGALIATEFLFHWRAVQYPESRAAQTVKDLGLPSGRMRHNMYNGNFNTPAVLFHESLTDDYLTMRQNNGGEPYDQLDAIICLAATDDWERATAFLTPRQQARLNNR